MTTALKAVACSLALLMAAPLPYAQDAKPANAADSSAQPTTLHVDVNVVSMAVTVRDKHGKIIPNLTKDDFDLQDDNHPQTIKYFNVDPNLPLTMGLLVDTSGSLRDALNDERNATQKFLDQMLTQKQDRAFLIEFNREVDLLADPTSKHEVLEKALDHLGDQPINVETHRDPPNSGDPDQNDGGGNNNGRGRRFSGAGTTLYDAIYLASDDVLSREKGRKAIIVLTDGEDRGSKETLHGAIEAAQRADTVVYAMYFKGEEHNNNNNGGFPGHRGGGGWPGGGGGWPGGGGGGYPGGGGGGYPGGGGGGGQRPEKSSVDGKKVLEQICGETGGRMFEVKKKELIEDIYNQIAEELRSQYILGYTPDKTVAGGGYHRITLLPKKKDQIVQTRQGYYSQD